MMSKTHKTVFDLGSTYLSIVKNSAGSRLFRHSFGRVAGRRTDLTRGGRLSCAFFVSSVLRMFGLIKEQHTTVAGTVRDLERSGWRRVAKPRPGDVLVWEAVPGSGGPHEHIGFFAGAGQAISNSARRRMPERHHWTYGTRSGRPVRRVIAAYRHPKLA